MANHGRRQAPQKPAATEPEPEQAPSPPAEVEPTHADTAPEPLAEQREDETAEPDAAPSEPEPEPDPLAGFDPNEDDGDTDEADDDDQAGGPVASPSSGRGTPGIRITYEGRGAVTVTVPDDGTAPDDPDAVITSGSTYTLRPGQTITVPSAHADWLSRHPVHSIKKL